MFSIKLEIASVQFLVSRTLGTYYEKWFDLGNILKIEQKELPIDWMWGVRMKSVSRFAYKFVVSVTTMLVWGLLGGSVG